MKLFRVIYFAWMVLLLSFSAMAGEQAAVHSGRPRAGEKSLRQARQELYQEWVPFQVMGRSHTPDEKKRIRVLDQSVKSLDKVIEDLGYIKVEEGETSPEY